jgi:hypothetical protein
MKKLQLEEFLEDGTTVEDICRSIEEMLSLKAEQLILDPISNQPRIDADERFKNFIESEI